MCTLWEKAVKNLLVIAGACLLTACALESLHPGYENMNVQRSSDTLRVYDEDGNFAGTIDEGSGRIYDRDGNFIGRIKK